MKKATKAATGATDLSRRSLEQIERNTHLDQRAWVTVRGAILTKQLATGEKVVVKLEIINSGKTPALETETAGVVSERPDTPRVDPTLPATVSSRGVVGPGVVVTTEFESKVPITKDDIDWIQMGLNYIYVNGLIIYNDVFGQKHRTEFCFKISQKELQTQPFLMTDCDVGNTAD